MSDKIFEKILCYENFVNEVLKEDLRIVHERWDKYMTEMTEWVDLRNILNTVDDVGLDEGFKTQMDIGTNIYAQAKIPDISKLFINVGCGIYIEFEQDEALKFIEKRIKGLVEQIGVLKINSAKIKARIKLVLHGIQELSMIK